MIRKPTFRGGAAYLWLLLALAGSVPAQAPAPVSSHEKAARELFQLIGGTRVAEVGAEAMMGSVLENSELAPYEDVFRAWIHKVFASNDFESELVRLYMNAFSEAELRELAAFYKTPVGRKAIATLPELMKQGAELGVRRGQERAADLEEMLVKAKQEREGPPGDVQAQKRTVADIRNTGTAMFSWLTDQVGAGAAGQSQTEKGTQTVSLTQYSPISHEELEKLLVPEYIQAIPKTDGWGHPYEFYLNVEDPLAQQVLGIRSPGRDGEYSSTDYVVGPFTPESFDEDIVWTDGFFLRWPQAPKKQ